MAHSSIIYLVVIATCHAARVGVRKSFAKQNISSVDMPDHQANPLPEPVMSQEDVNLRDEIIKEKQMWEQNVEDQDFEMEPAEAEKTFQKENKRCSKKKGKCVPTDSHDNGINPYNPFVNLCEEYRMPNDFGSAVCRVSEAWMLTGEPAKTVAWWSSLQMELIKAKIDKVQKHCLQNSFKDWLTGKCKRRFVQIFRAMGLLSKAIREKSYTAAVKLSPAKIQELQTDLTEVQNSFKPMLFSMMSKSDKDVNDDVKDAKSAAKSKLLERVFTVMEKDPRNVYKNAIITQIVNTFVQGGSYAEAETLVKQLEKQTAADSNRNSDSVSIDEAKGIGEEVDKGLEETMTMLNEQVESMEADFKSANSLL